MLCIGGGDPSAAAGLHSIQRRTELSQIADNPFVEGDVTLQQEEE